MISQTIDFLEANKGVLGLKLVGNAADFQTAADANPTAAPAVYVLQLEEVPEPSDVDVIVQRVTAYMGIAFAVRNVADAKGAAARADLESMRANVKQLLYGWQPAEGYFPLERGRSSLLGFKNSHLWWQDIYVSAYYDKPQ